MNDVHAASADAPRSGEFFAPVPLAFVALMVVNDRWLKAAFRSALTGKLSDVAICFFMPLFVSELLGLSLGVRPRVRLWIGAVVTTTLFAALEMLQPVTALALDVLTRIGPLVGVAGPFRMTSDVTDLLCLLVIPVALTYGARRLDCTLWAER